MEVKIKAKKFNWPLVGNKNIADFLSKSLDNGNLAGSYIFLGPDGLGKTTIAFRFAQILLCTEKEAVNFPCEKCNSCRFFKKSETSDSQVAHGDLHLIKKEPDKKNISVDQIRSFINIISLSSFLGNYKMGIINGAENLSLEASNSLLKTLEEPNKKVVMILTASSLANLPETIISRSQVLNFRPVKSDIIYDYLINEKGASRSQAKNLSSLCQGRPALALKFFEDKDYFKDFSDKSEIFLNFFKQNINDRLKSLEDSLGKTIVGQKGSELAEKTVFIWRGVARDLLLFYFGQKNLIQHQELVLKYQDLNGKIKIENILNLFKILEKSSDYFKANVNPKLSLEQIVINI